MIDELYDCAIIGGGVAGLSLSILLARSGKTVILFEKEAYPFHKVCGEYISTESIPFLKYLGIDLEAQDLPKMDWLLLSSPSGITIKRPLDIGGVGVSRFLLDEMLYKVALNAGVEVRANTKVQEVCFNENRFQINTSDQVFQSKTCVGCYGKNSNLDVKLGRKYKAKNDKDLFIAVKYHIRADYDKNFVEMHNFSGGYCGMSAIENGLVNISYISRASNLKKHGSIAAMERNVLSKNPHLKKYFDHARFVNQKPLVISHLYFGMKTQVSNHILMLGDAAGNIAPLSGNGMSMAFQSAKIAHENLVEFLNNKMTREGLESKYTAGYRKRFYSRILVARYIQRFFGSAGLTDLLFRFLKVFPKLIDGMGKRIHG